MTDLSKSNINKFFPWFIWVIAASFFFSGYAVRVAPNVMATGLMKDFAENATFVGVLTSCFFYPYVFMQIPAGLLIDRYNAQTLLGVMALISGLTCLLFASASSAFPAYIGRGLFGAAFAFAFVGAIKLSSGWHPPSRMGMIVGLTQASGMLGGALGLEPIARSTETWGWQYTSILLAILLVGVGFLILLFAKDNKSRLQSFKQSETFSIWQAFTIVMKNPQSWFNAIFVALLYFPGAIFGEVWGVTYLQEAYGISKPDASWLTGFMFYGWVVGCPLWAWFSAYIKRRRLCMIFSNLFSLIFFALIIFIPNLPWFFLAALILLFGIANSGVVLSYTLAAEINPRRVSATSIAFANMASVVFTAMLAPVISYILDIIRIQENTNKYSAHGFITIFSLLAIGLIIGFFFVYKVKETYCEVISE